MKWRSHVIFIGLVKGCVVVCGTVMDYKLAVGEEKAVALHLVGRCADLRHLFLAQLRQIVDRLPFVYAVWDHEPELEAKVLENSASEVVALDDLQVLHRLRTDTEAHSQTHSLQTEEVWAHVILD